MSEDCGCVLDYIPGPLEIIDRSACRYAELEEENKRSLDHIAKLGGDIIELSKANAELARLNSELEEALIDIKRAANDTQKTNTQALIYIMGVLSRFGFDVG